MSEEVERVVDAIVEARKSMLPFAPFKFYLTEHELEHYRTFFDGTDEEWVKWVDDCVTIIRPWNER